MIPEYIKSIKLSDFDYHLPDSYIAQEPLNKRDESKLLVYDGESITHCIFKELPELLPPGSQLILNNARVIPARLRFFRSSGARIEVFLLEPMLPHAQMELALRVKSKCVWLCMIGNLKRWKNDEVLSIKLDGENATITLNARIYSREEQLVELSWDADHSFSEILDIAGKTPLPPYIKRDADINDLTSYQTVFAKMDGAVAAPTAGLHFSREIFEKMYAKEIKTSEVTLYVGAGTFAPVTVQYMIDHPMHAEMISVDKETIENLCIDQTRIAVGTTSLRTLESLYWIGVKISRKEADPLTIEQLYPYSFPSPPLSWVESIKIIKEYMNNHGIKNLLAKTAIMIMPGYKFMSVNGLITNFHYPNTTLIMLVAAFTGDNWKDIYKEAIENNYRFLSYGDSSLLWNPRGNPKKQIINIK